MGIELTPAAKQLLAEKGYDPVLGARPLRRTIQREIEDALSEKILFGELTPGQIVVVDVEGEGLLSSPTRASRAVRSRRTRSAVGASYGTPGLGHRPAGRRPDHQRQRGREPCPRWADPAPHDDERPGPHGPGRSSRPGSGCGGRVGACLDSC